MPVRSRSRAALPSRPTSAAPKRKLIRRTRSPLQVIPGIGVAMTGDLNRLGIEEVAQLKGRDPQQLYDELSALDGVPHDRCVLYVFRCAVYYASHSRHDPEKLKWWNWKDDAQRNLPRVARRTPPRRDSTGRGKRRP